MCRMQITRTIKFGTYEMRRLNRIWVTKTRRNDMDSKSIYFFISIDWLMHYLIDSLSDWQMVKYEISI